MLLLGVLSASKDQYILHKMHLDESNEFLKDV